MLHTLLKKKERKLIELSGCRAINIVFFLQLRLVSHSQYDGKCNDWHRFGLNGRKSNQSYLCRQVLIVLRVFPIDIMHCAFNLDGIIV